MHPHMQPWEAWEPPPKLGFMELINQYEIMQHLWLVVKLDVFFHVFLHVKHCDQAWILI